MPLPDDLDRTGLLAEAKGGDNAPALSVSELSGALKRTVETAFGHVRVRGEISGWKRHGSGHCYFTLKDENACIDAVIWKGQAASLAFRPEDGAEVICTGKLTTYAGRSKYQIVVTRMELAGEGALMALLDRRRRALAAEGLFDEARKRRLPFLPRLIGVVTSPTGAVIRDILHRLEHRCPTRVMVWPVPVQGEGSADKIAAAIRGFANMDPRPDLLIVARGGGSIEDLWAFNEEAVVRAAAESPIPLISAVGHETDTTLIDFASDRRAPTPTAAAEMAVPVRAELAGMLAEAQHRMASTMDRTWARLGERLDLAAQRWPEAANLFAPFSQRIDELGDRLPRGLVQRTAHARADHAEVAPRLQPRLLTDRIARGHEKLLSLWRLAELAHPERPLQRGFVRVTDRAGKTLVHAADARAAGAIDLHFADGRVAAQVGDLVGPKAFRPARRVERKPSNPYLPGQADLFGDED
ncbi:exodeoxyribonuclease VII large subunit [Sphingomonas xanthus]|uniref:Exodeoxyribonuclease 7 large subunit n=1 Tax=Sphingomonas xanthus TaxID=2594473 RepID=A0A516IS52_9SPHN|nr:exodeoxyribonuclease VII large subunit [Sphingomonas xanthus]QDP19743.1 exodeoxyribonuclease VII large subunit [Sphingomonas xanthus]